MAKLSLTKLFVNKTAEPNKIQINGSEIEVLSYLPIDDKASFITAVMNAAIDENGIFSPVRVQIYTDLNLIRYYTNLNLTDKMYDEPSKTYDLLYINNIITSVKNTIPEAEYTFLINSLNACIDDVRRYNSSAMGVMKQIATDYKDTNLDVTQMFEKLGDPEQFALVRDVLNKLG